MSGEFELIRRYFTRPAGRAVLGIGDDCALLRPSPGMQLAVSTDMLVEGTHFLRGTPPGNLGWKTLAVNLSDLAAMGAEPAYATLAVSLPGADEAWIAAFAEGFLRLAERHGVELIGGDTTRGPLTFCVTVIGEVPVEGALRRDGALAGDDIWLSGATGEAALGLAVLEGRLALPEPARGDCIARLERPEPRLTLGRRLRGIANSAIDVSDGLVADLGHIAQASGISMALCEDWLPDTAALQGCADAVLKRECRLGGGDDYELAFTAPASERGSLQALSDELAIPLSRIGTVLDAPTGEVRVKDARGSWIPVPHPGYDHFR